ncbi:hypothetical protein ABT202_25765 [Streptomyces sp900105245]|uniref:hypothetical protein n=1 Tax=Streptomyces sp. 900105245 TaxID=3154379 RepID=UPI0033294E43
MCSRYVSTRRPQDLTQLSHAAEWPTAEALARNWNVAPADDVWAVLERTPPSEGPAAASRELRPLPSVNPAAPPQPGAEQHPRRPRPGIR